jgi:hypothetical protein
MDGIFLGERWTLDDVYDARHVLSAVYEGVDCGLSVARMRELERRGLVVDIVERPRGRYEYQWTPKLERLVEESRAISPDYR